MIDLRHFPLDIIRYEVSIFPKYCDLSLKINYLYPIFKFVLVVFFKLRKHHPCFLNFYELHPATSRKWISELRKSYMSCDATYITIWNVPYICAIILANLTHTATGGHLFVYLTKTVFITKTMKKNGIDRTCIQLLRPVYRLYKNSPYLIEIADGIFCRLWHERQSTRVAYL